MNNNPSITSYVQAAAYLDNGHGKPKGERPLHGRTTRLMRIDSLHIAIRYHNTDIVTYCQNGNTVLNSGGYKTVTTKRKINEYAPIRLYQNKSIWYANGELFADGMIIHADGKLSGTLPASDTKRQAKLVKRINTYARAYVDALFAGNVPAPSGGDCWICLMKMGNDTVHLFSHMREKYYVPSLILRAIENFPVSPFTRNELNGIWVNGGPSAYLQDFCKKQLYASLRRYMRRSFGLPS